MDPFIIMLGIIYATGIFVTIIFNFSDWKWASSWGTEEERRHYARAILLSPFWPRYIIYGFEGLTSCFKSLSYSVKQLIKDAR